MVSKFTRVGRSILGAATAATATPEDAGVVVRGATAKAAGGGGVAAKNSATAAKNSTTRTASIIISSIRTNKKSATEGGGKATTTKEETNDGGNKKETTANKHHNNDATATATARRSRSRTRTRTRTRTRSKERRSRTRSRSKSRSRSRTRSKEERCDGNSDRVEEARKRGNNSRGEGSGRCSAADGGGGGGNNGGVTNIGARISRKAQTGTTTASNSVAAGCSDNKKEKEKTSTSTGKSDPRQAVKKRKKSREKKQQQQPKQQQQKEEDLPERQQPAAMKKPDEVKEKEKEKQQQQLQKHHQHHQQQEAVIRTTKPDGRKEQQQLRQPTPQLLAKQKSQPLIQPYELPPQLRQQPAEIMNSAGDQQLRLAADNSRSGRRSVDDECGATGSGTTKKTTSTGMAALLGLTRGERVKAFDAVIRSIVAEEKMSKEVAARETLGAVWEYLCERYGPDDVAAAKSAFGSILTEHPLFGRVAGAGATSASRGVFDRYGGGFFGDASTISTVTELVSMLNEEEDQIKRYVIVPGVRRVKQAKTREETSTAMDELHHNLSRLLDPSDEESVAELVVKAVKESLVEDGGAVDDAEEGFGNEKEEAPADVVDEKIPANEAEPVEDGEVQGREEEEEEEEVTEVEEEEEKKEEEDSAWMIESAPAFISPNPTTATFASSSRLAEGGNGRNSCGGGDDENVAAAFEHVYRSVTMLMNLSKQQQSKLFRRIAERISIEKGAGQNGAAADGDVLDSFQDILESLQRASREEGIEKAKDKKELQPTKAVAKHQQKEEGASITSASTTHTYKTITIPDSVSREIVVPGIELVKKSKGSDELNAAMDDLYNKLRKRLPRNNYSDGEITKYVADAVKTSFRSSSRL